MSGLFYIVWSHITPTIIKDIFFINAKIIMQGIIPIWQDTYYTAATDPFNYYITVNNNGTEREIFRGVARVMPTETNVKINIARICENYLNSDFPEGFATAEGFPTADVSGGTTILLPNAVRTFYLRNGDGGTLLDSYTFLNCWDKRYQSGDTFFPLYCGMCVDCLIPGQYILAPFLQNDQLYVDVIKYDGSSVSDNCPYCGRYAIYFVTRNGGWAQMPFNEKSKRTDNYDRHYIERSYDSSTAQFGKKPYRNNITSTYELHTQFMPDEYSEDFAYNFFSSNSMYLHDICEGKMYPVYVDSTSQEYKKFKNEKKLVSYTINVHTSQIEQILG